MFFTEFRPTVLPLWVLGCPDARPRPNAQGVAARQYTTMKKQQLEEL